MSEIFDEYARIATEQGLVKKAKDEPKKSNPRYDSLDLEAIEMLYGIKPNGDEKHIVERAHPDSVVVAPAYDRVNGLVENLLERQDIMVGIARKPNDGKSVQRRYVVAHDELLNEVLKTAFLLDKKGENDLMKLADTCAARLSDDLVKTAWSWSDFGEALGVGGVAVGAGALTSWLGAGAAVALGLTPVGWGVAAGTIAAAVLINNFSDHIDQKVTENCNSAIDKLTRVLDDPAEAANNDSDIHLMIADIRNTRDLGQTAKSLSAKTKSDIELGKSTLKEYFSAITALHKKIPTWIGLLNSVHESEGALGGSYFGSGLVKVLERGLGAIISSDVEKAIKSLSTLDESLDASKENLISLHSTTKEFVINNQKPLLDMIKKETQGLNEGLTE